VRSHESSGVSRDRDVSRRELLGVIGAAAAGLTLGRGRALLAADSTAGPTTLPSEAAQPFRFVHLTDIHVQHELRGAEGFRRCVQAVHALEPRPDFILTGGDLVFDILSQSEERSRQLFDLFTSICKDSDIPWRHCIGNHDVFGWSSKGRIAPDHVSYGKKMAQERLGLERTTYSFDHKGWHFVAVDDIQPHAGGGYEGGFSEEDLHWLDRDLSAAGDRPKVLCMHIPIISVTVFRGVDVTGKNADITVSKGLVCRNPGPILDLLRRRKVTLALSGHKHENETLQYEKTTHIEDGAVCGAWWKGPHNGNPEGFGVIDVRPDGAFEHQYHTYGWVAEKA
jgi:3',5'-cyclic AMP phosphodiesterase CpdA